MKSLFALLFAFSASSVQAQDAPAQQTPAPLVVTAEAASLRAAVVYNDAAITEGPRVRVMRAPYAIQTFTFKNLGENKIIVTEIGASVVCGNDEGNNGDDTKVMAKVPFILSEGESSPNVAFTNLPDCNYSNMLVIVEIKGTIVNSFRSDAAEGEDLKLETIFVVDTY